MLDARFAALALAFALAAPAALRPAASSIGAPAAVRVGPPLLCFPLDIGGAASLPFAGEGFEVKTRMAPDEIAQSLRSLLAASDDVVVHMETLRRAAVWLMSLESEGSGATGPQQQNGAKLKTLLTDELLLAASADSDAKGDASRTTRQVALRWFDLGYFLSAAGQARVLDPGRAQTWLERAVRMEPDDPALRFGVALAELDIRSDGNGTKWARHLVRLFDEPKSAAAAAAPANPANPANPASAANTANTANTAITANLRKNVLATFGLFLKQQDWDKLGAEVRKQSGRS